MWGEPDALIPNVEDGNLALKEYVPVNLVREPQVTLKATVTGLTTPRSQHSLSNSDCNGGRLVLPSRWIVGPKKVETHCCSPIPHSS